MYVVDKDPIGRVATWSTLAICGSEVDCRRLRQIGLNCVVQFLGNRGSRESNLSAEWKRGIRLGDGKNCLGIIYARWTRSQF